MYVGIKRRTFVIGGVGAAVVGTSTYAWLRERGYAVDPPLAPKAGEKRDPVGPIAFAPFDPPAMAILDLVVVQILPGDAEKNLPDAREAGVLDFIVSACQLPGFLPIRNDILKLTRQLDIAAQSLRGTRYVELPADARDTVLEDIRRGTDKRRTFDPQAALEVLIRLSLEGYLGHPRHGGNQGGKVWAALKIDMPIDIETGHGGHHP